MAASQHGWFSETVYLALLPAYAYALAFAYEIGFCSATNIPFYLIESSATQILFVSLSLAALIVISFFPTAFMLYGDAEPTGRSYPMIRRLFRFSVWTLLSWAAFLSAGTVRFIILGILFIVFYNYFLSPLFNDASKSGEGYLDKLKRYDERKMEDGSIFSRFGSRLGFTRTTLLLLVVLLIGASFFIGKGNGEHQHVFFIVDDFLILRQYGDYFVCVRWEKGMDAIPSEFVLISKKAVAENKGVLIETYTGKLRFTRVPHHPI